MMRFQLKKGCTRDDALCDHTRVSHHPLFSAEFAEYSWHLRSLLAVKLAVKFDVKSTSLAVVPMCGLTWFIH